MSEPSGTEAEVGPGARLRAAAREHGVVALFYAVCAVALLFLLRDWRLESFEHGFGSQATLWNLDVAARSASFLRAGLLFVAVFGGVLVVLSLGARALGAVDLAVLRASSLAGLALLLADTFLLRGPEWRTLGPHLLVPAGHLLLIGTALLDRLVFRRCAHPERAAHLAWLAASGLALAVPLGARSGTLGLPGRAFAALSVLGAGLALHVLLQLIALPGRASGAGPRRARRLELALVPLLGLGLLPVLANEACLLLNARGVLLDGLGGLRAGLLAALGLWIAARYARGGAAPAGALRASLGRLGFPLLLLGASCFAGHVLFLSPSVDFFEPANTGLSIQQWREFGRLPYFETFDGHGLSGSLFGFLYSLLDGGADPVWMYWDFLYAGVGLLLGYAVLLRASGSPYAALFVVLFLPHAEALFPEYCAFGLSTLFVLPWALRRDTVAGYALLALYTCFVVLWRIDVGFASGVASAAVIAARRWLAPARGPWLGRLAVGGALALAAVGLVAVGLAASQGVALAPVLRDVLHITGSSQAFGFKGLAKVYDATVWWHYSIVPLAVLSLGALALLGRADAPKVPARSAFLSLALVFLAVYYLANFQRGLVRHSFAGASSFVASFSYLALGLAAWWWPGRWSALQRFGAFAGLTLVLANAFPPENVEDAGKPRQVQSLYARSVDRLRSYKAVERIREPEGRRRFSGRFFAQHLRTFLDFVDAQLAPGETFLDVSSSPMLYYFAHRESPPYPNHLMLAHDEHLQRRVIERAQGLEVPFAVVHVEEDLAQRLNRANLDKVDGVPIALRQHRLYEWIYARYEPLGVLDRWMVWIRKDHLLRAEPDWDAPRELGRWSAGSEGRRAPASAAELRVGPRPPGRPLPGGEPMKGAGTYCVHMEGPFPADGRLRVRWTTRAADGLREEERVVRADGAEGERWFLLPLPPYGDRGVRLVEVGLEQLDGGAPPLRSARLLEAAWPVRAPAAARLARSEQFHLRELARLWGEYGGVDADPEALLDDPLARLREQGGPLTPVGLQDFDGQSWTAGLHTARAAALLANRYDLDRIHPGDRVRFASGATRRIRSVEGRELRLGGAPLDPAVDGFPHRVDHYDVTSWGPRIGADGAVRLPRGEELRLELGPLRPTGGGTDLLLRGRADGKARNLIVRYGRDAQPGAGPTIGGSFSIDLPGDEGEHAYSVRLSVQAQWWLAQADWISVAASAGDFELTEATLRADPWDLDGEEGR